MREYIIILITACVGMAGTVLRAWLQTKFKPEQLNTVMGIAQSVVSAADQAGDKLGWGGPEKYEYAQTALESLSKRVGIKLKPEEANSLIHASLKSVRDVQKYNESTVGQSFQQGVEYGVNQLLAELEKQAPVVDTAEAVKN